MKIFKRIVFSAIILLLVVAAGFYIGDYFHRYDMRNLDDSHPHFHEMLNLTQEQLDKLVPIENKFSKEKAFYENQIRLANMELAMIMKKEKAYTPEVKAAVEKVHVAMGELQKVTIVHLFEMRSLLDEKQTQIFDDYVAEAMHGL